MRRKSERNKTKSSPEKKPEKPTRKSTRRRTKKSPSTSPERGDNSNDGIDNTKNDKEQPQQRRQTRLRSRENTPIKLIPSTTQTAAAATTTTTTTTTTTAATAATTTSRSMSPLIEETDTKVTSTEPTTPTKKQDEVDESGSVWKVARADASPGQIQKLKICRQRNLSETSDVSLSKKRSSKWQDNSDGVAESADSADEPPTTSNDGIKNNNDTTIDDTTSITGRDSGEEVSDRKEIPSDDITTVNMSDVKKNIDKPQQPDDGDKDDGQGQKDAKDEDNNDASESTTTPTPTPTTTTTTTAAAAAVDDDDDTPSKEDVKTDVQNNDNDDKPDKSDEDREDKLIKQETIQDNDDDKNKSTIDDTIKSSTDDKSDDKNIEINSIVDEEIKKENVTIVDDEKINNKDEIKEKKLSPSSSDNDEDNKKHSESSDKSNDESKNDIPTSTRPVRLTRRKHRDKYRDSSNSDSGDSDDEPRRQNKNKSEANIEKMKIEEKKNEDIKINKNLELKNVEKDNTDKENKKSEIIKKEKSDNIKREKSESPDVHLDIHADTENDKEKLSDTEENNDCNKKLTNDSVEIKNEQVDQNETIEKTTIKPSKVCLKRTFSRASVEIKKDDADSLNDPSQDKENHVSETSKILPKRRRWGTSVLTTDTTPVLSISTDSLQALVPGAKPLSMSEVRLTKDDDEVKERRREPEKHHEINNGDDVDDDDDEEEDKEENEPVKIDNSKDNQLARRKISIVKDTSQLSSPNSPSVQVSNVLFIKNLVRPFTMTQLKELLSRTGTIIENGFWMDRIKSKAYVEYANEDQAFETRQALHGISWPISNPKKLIVEYATKEAMNEAKESLKELPPTKKVETVSTGENNNWPNIWDRDDKINTTAKVTVVREWDLGKEDDQHNLKDKEREKKDIDNKKRKQRSRSPLNDSHLPAPARKFKKKEDDAPPAKLLDDLFKKTKATPCIYWLPLTNEQIVVKEEMRRKAMAENARRLEEFRRIGNRDNRHRRSPRK